MSFTLQVDRTDGSPAQAGAAEAAVIEPSAWGEFQ